MISPKVILSKLFETKVGQGSIILFLASFLSGFLNYLFNPIMGRFLGPNLYGELASLLSLLNLTSVVTLALGTVVVKFTADFKAKGENTKINELLLGLTNKFFLVSGLFFITFAFSSKYIADFLKLNHNLPVIILAALIAISFFLTINNGVLQGLLNFTFYSISLLSQSLTRLIFGFLVVFLGFKLNGVMFAILFGLGLTYILTFYPLRRYLKKIPNKLEFPWKGLFSYSLTTFISILGLALIMTTDIVLVKHFFSASEAGLYSAASLTAKIILFLVAPVILVMFPLISERASSNKGYIHLLYYTFGFALLVGGILTIIYFLFSEFILGILFGQKYLEVAPILGMFALFIFLYTLSTVLVYFYLSIQKIKVSTIPFLISLLQIILIWFYHSSLLVVLQINLLVSALLLFLLMVYYAKLKISYGKY